MRYGAIKSLFFEDFLSQFTAISRLRFWFDKKDMTTKPVVALQFVVRMLGVVNQLRTLYTLTDHELYGNKNTFATHAKYLIATHRSVFPGGKASPLKLCSHAYASMYALKIFM